MSYENEYGHIAEGTMPEIVTMEDEPVVEVADGIVTMESEEEEKKADYNDAIRKGATAAGITLGLCVLAELASWGMKKLGIHIKFQSPVVITRDKPEESTENNSDDTAQSN